MRVFIRPEIRKASEIKYHHDTAPGKRSVFVDHRLYPQSEFYVIGRRIEFVHKDQPDYVDAHRHNCNSYYLFIGDNEDLSGLKAKVRIEDHEIILESPSSVTIPEKLLHTYRLIEGKGWFVHIVLNPNFNASLYEGEAKAEKNQANKLFSKASRQDKNPKEVERPISSKKRIVQNPQRYIFVNPKFYQKPGIYVAAHKVSRGIPFTYNMVFHKHNQGEIYVLLNKENKEFSANFYEPYNKRTVVNAPSLVYHTKNTYHRCEPYKGEGIVVIVLKEDNPGEGYKFAKMEPQLKEIRIELTQKCNMSCDYCYVENTTKTEGNKEISFEEIKQVITDGMMQGLDTVSLTGGEPFMRYDLVKKVIRLASEKGLNTGILTNGVLCTQDMIMELKKLGLTWIRVSLDGSKKEINAHCRDKKGFNNIIRTIKDSKKVGLNVVVRTTATNKNVYDLKGIINLAKDLRVERIDIQPMFPTNNKRIDGKLLLDKKNHKRAAAKLLGLRKQLSKTPLDIILYSNWFEFLLPEYQGEPVYMSKCGRSFCFVDTHGFVKTCGPNTRILGNIRNKSILEIWNSSEHLKQLRKHERYEVCKTCDNFDICLTCPSDTYNLYRELCHSPPLCPRVRESKYGHYP